MLKISVSGVRGITPDSLTPEVCLEFAKAFGTYLEGGSVVIGCDTRRSSEFIKGIVIEGLISSGCKVVDLGIAATPTVGVMARELKAAGGAIITASHNPEPWNGLKFLREDGIFLNQQQAEKLLRIYHAKQFVGRGGGSCRTCAKGNDVHIKKILKHVDPAPIKRRKFKVVIDACNGAGSVITPLLLRKLGCEVVELNTRPSSPFNRGAGPTPENLTELVELVKKEKADAGFAQDPDADRLAMVVDGGKAVSEEYTLAVCMKMVLSKASKPNKIVVANLSTTAALDDIAREYGAVVMRTKIGEVYVAEEIKKVKAVIGGEGNGGVILPKIGYNRDSLAGIALVLSHMAREKKKLSEIVAGIPEYFLVKKKIECHSGEEALKFLEKAKEKFGSETLDLTEGVKVIRKDGWIHLRPSNTEPIIRVFAEAREKKLAESYVSEALNL